jgi:hypothetical protein
MREGRETEVRETGPQSQANVVRLPRDWLGPREELVPFGPRVASLDAETAPPADNGEAAPSSDNGEAAPPSAEDFWGERAAAIHDALQAPANPAHPDTRSAGLAGTRGASRPPRVDVARGGPGKAIRGVPLPGADRRIVAAVAAGVAIAAVVVIAFSSDVSRPRVSAQALGRSQAGFAAVLSGGVSKVLRVARTELGTLRGDTAVVARASASRVRGTPHAARTPKPTQKVTSPPQSPTVSFSSSAAAPSSSTLTEAPSSSAPASTQTYAASHEPASTHGAAAPTYRSAPTHSGSSSTNPSKATLSSLITGAGTCSCR